MSGAGSDTVNEWFDLTVLLVSGAGVVFSVLTRIAWSTKVTKDEVEEMIRQAVDGIAAAGREARLQMEGRFHEAQSSERALTDAKLERLRAGVEYQNRQIDRLIQILDRKGGLM